ncbi:MAG: hypothetical protein RMK15_11925 [Chloroflexota bacterium]|nr:hypothetical protein [Chloroflexota bacterium]
MLNILAALVALMALLTGGGSALATDLPGYADVFQHQPACVDERQSDAMGGPCPNQELLAVESGKPCLWCGGLAVSSGTPAGASILEVKGERAVIYEVK